jgi:hypothetical protein
MSIYCGKRCIWPTSTTLNSNPVVSRLLLWSELAKTENYGALSVVYIVYQICLIIYTFPIISSTTELVVHLHTYYWCDYADKVFGLQIYTGHASYVSLTTIRVYHFLQSTTNLCDTSLVVVGNPFTSPTVSKGVQWNYYYVRHQIHLPYWIGTIGFHLSDMSIPYYFL